MSAVATGARHQHGGGRAGAFQSKFCLPCSLTAPRSARSALVAQLNAALRSSTVTGAFFTLATIFTLVMLSDATGRG